MIINVSVALEGNIKEHEGRAIISFNIRTIRAVCGKVAEEELKDGEEEEEKKEKEEYI